MPSTPQGDFFGERFVALRDSLPEPARKGLDAIPQEHVLAALKAHPDEVRPALAELGLNPSFNSLLELLGARGIGESFAISPLDAAQALGDLHEIGVEKLATLARASARPAEVGRVYARSGVSFMKGMRTIASTGHERSWAEFEKLVPGGVRGRIGRFPEDPRGGAWTLLNLFARLREELGRGAVLLPADRPDALPMGCEVEVPEIPGYPAGGANVFALYTGLGLGEDELVEFSLPPSRGHEVQVALIDLLGSLGLLPPGRTLSLHITCETPGELADSAELDRGMKAVSFCIAFLTSADRRLAGGQIFKNYRIKTRGIRGMKWQGAVGAEYRLGNVCTGASDEPGVLGDALRAHETALAIAERLHGELVAGLEGGGSAWPEFSERLNRWVSGNGLGELLERDRNVTGELSTLFASKRTEALQRGLGRKLIAESFPGLERV